MAYDRTLPRVAKQDLTRDALSSNGNYLAIDYALPVPEAQARRKPRLDHAKVISGLATALLSTAIFIAAVVGLAIGLSVVSVAFAFLLAPVSASIGVSTGLVLLGLAFRRHIARKAVAIRDNLRERFHHSATEAA